MGTRRCTTCLYPRSPAWQGALDMAGGTGDKAVDHNPALRCLHFSSERVKAKLGHLVFHIPSHSTESRAKLSLDQKCEWAVFHLACGLLVHSAVERRNVEYYTYTAYVRHIVWCRRRPVPTGETCAFSSHNVVRSWSPLLPVGGIRIAAVP